MNLSGKNIVYIGGCGGIGSATCKRLVQKKVANLIILDLLENTKLIEEIIALNPSTSVSFLNVDLRSKENVQKCIRDIVSKIGYIDVLVNGGGIFNEVDPELTISVNLLGVIHGTMAAVDLMDKTKGNRGGLIVNIASTLGIDPSAFTPVYCASKAGVVLFTRSVAIKTASDNNGVSLIVICPGLTRTGLLNQFTSSDASPSSDHLKQAFTKLEGQDSDDCARSIVEAIEINKNKAVYICDVGRIQELPLKRFWNKD